jgi:hypothetical protein
VALACGLTLLWAALYLRAAHLGICDEPGHWGNLEHFRDGRPGWPDSLPHPPGYYHAVLALTAWQPTPDRARAVTCAFALLALWAFNGARRRIHGDRPGAAVLLLALLPIFQPFTAMIYTDVPALALVLSAVWAQLAGRRWLAGALLAAACWIRQTSVIWGTLLLAIEAYRHWPGPAPLGARALALARVLWRRAPGLILTHAAVAAVVVAAGRLTPGTRHGNALSPNLANLHFGAVLFCALTLPLWFTHGRRVFDTLRSRPGLLTSGLAAVAALAFAYANPHEWNRDLWWPDTSFTLLRNWPLVAADRWPLLRWAWSLLAMLGVAGAVVVLRGQAFRGELLLVALFSLILLSTNGLVEPRYFITPAVFWLLFAEFSLRGFVLLVGWFALICAVHAPFIMRTLSLW